jgi:hypothetical protein
MQLCVNELNIGICVDVIPDDSMDFVYLFTKADGIYDTHRRKVIRYYEELSAEELESVICSYVEHNICHAPNNIIYPTQRSGEQELFDPEE